MQAMDLKASCPSVTRAAPARAGAPLSHAHFRNTWLPKPSKEYPPVHSILNAARFLSQFTFKNTIFTSHCITKPINCCLLAVCVNQQIHSFQSPLLPAAKRWANLYISVAFDSHSWEAFTATHNQLKNRRGKKVIKPLPSYHYSTDKVLP